MNKLVYIHQVGDEYFISTLDNPKASRYMYGPVSSNALAVKICTHLNTIVRENMIREIHSIDFDALKL